MYVVNKNNSLDFIKLIASIQVFLVHALNHLNIHDYSSLKLVISLFQGVPVFFMISGYLIWNSIDQSKSLAHFLRKRVWRLYPELWLAIFISVTSIVLIKPEIIQIDRFIAFCVTQGTILQFWTPDCLRSFGCGTPNGALWTICVMVQCYIILYYINLSLKRGDKYLNVLFIISVLSNVILPCLKSNMPLLIYKLICHTFLPYMWLFILGVYIRLYKSRIEKVIVQYWLSFILLSFLLSYFKLLGLGIYGVIENLLLCIGIFGLAFNKNITFFEIDVDISYQIYIYHMIIINVFIEYSLTGKLTYLLYSFFLTCILALISYNTVGLYSNRYRIKIREEL